VSFSFNAPTQNTIRTTPLNALYLWYFLLSLGIYWTLTNKRIICTLGYRKSPPGNSNAILKTDFQLTL